MELLSMSKQPPIPRDQQDRVPAGHADTDPTEQAEVRASKARDRNVKTQGRQANIRQNTHYQQDR